MGSGDAAHWRCTGYARLGNAAGDDESKLHDTAGPTVGDLEQVKYWPR